MLGDLVRIVGAPQAICCLSSPGAGRGDMAYDRLLLQLPQPVPAFPHMASTAAPGRRTFGRTIGVLLLNLRQLQCLPRRL